MTFCYDDEDDDCHNYVLFEIMFSLMTVIIIVLADVIKFPIWAIIGIACFWQSQTTL